MDDYAGDSSRPTGASDSNLCSSAAPGAGTDRALPAAFRTRCWGGVDVIPNHSPLTATVELDASRQPRCLYVLAAMAFRFALRRNIPGHNVEGTVGPRREAVILLDSQEQHGEADSRCGNRSVGAVVDVAELVVALPRKQDLASVMSMASVWTPLWYIQVAVAGGGGVCMRKAGGRSQQRPQYSSAAGPCRPPPRSFWRVRLLQAT